MTKQYYAHTLRNYICARTACCDCVIDPIAGKSCVAYVSANPDEAIVDIITSLLYRKEKFPVENLILKI